MRNSRLFLFLIPAALQGAYADPGLSGSVAADGGTATADGEFAAADALLAREVDQGRTPSVQYVHFGPDTIFHVFRRGFSDLATGRKVGAGTTFNAYSVTKTFTAVAVLQLAERGLLSLEDPVRRRLPGAPVPEGMTIAQLLSHTSGLANPMPMRWIHARREHAGFDRNAFFRPILAKHGPSGDAPGTRFRYSNLGYVLLGQIIEAVSGLGYERYVEENIISRLGVAPGDLGFTAPEGRHAVGYHSRYSLSMLALRFLIDKPEYMGESVGAWTPFREHYVNGAPYGGLIGNAAAFVKFGQALLRDRGGLLADSSRARLFRETSLAGKGPTGMALAFYVGNLEGRTYVTHAGGGGGSYCELRLYPGLGSGSFLVFNRSGFSDARFLDRVDRLVLEDRRVAPGGGAAGAQGR